MTFASWRRRSRSLTSSTKQKGRVNRDDRRSDQPSLAINVVRSHGRATDGHVAQQPSPSPVSVMVHRVVQVLRPVLLAAKPREPLAMDTGREGNCAASGDPGAMEQVTQPFPETMPFVPSTPGGSDWKPIAILGLWSCGFGAIALIRFRGWHRIRAALRSSTPIEISATPRPSYTNKWRDRPKKYSKSVNEDVASNTAYSEKTGPILLPLEPLRPVAWLRSRQDLATAPNGPGPCTPASDIIHQDRNRPGVDPAAWAAGDPTPAEESWTASYTRLTAPRCAAIRCA
jgi:hypothetical protein